MSSSNIDSILNPVHRKTAAVPDSQWPTLFTSDYYELLWPRRVHSFTVPVYILCLRVSLLLQLTILPAPRVRNGFTFDCKKSGYEGDDVKYKLRKVLRRSGVSSDTD